MSKHKPAVEQIEAAMTHFKKEQLKLTELHFSDKQIREMLRPKTLIEQNPKALLILKCLNKYGRVPGPVLVKVFQVESKAYGSGTLHNLMLDDYVAAEKGTFNGRTCNIFRITKKGLQALKTGR